MATLTSAQHVFLFLWIIGSVAAEVLEAKSGEDVTLQCHIQTDAAVSKLVWIRPGLKGDEIVFFFRDNRLNENQDPRYHGRVELKDPEMKNGDASVVLKKVTVDDSGTYQCLVTPLNMPTKVLGSVLLIVSDGPTMEELRKQLKKLDTIEVLLVVILVLVVALGVGGFALGRFVFPKPKSGPL